MRISNYLAWDNLAITTGTFATDPIDLSQYFGCAIQLVWSGNAAGNFTVEVSSDHQSPTNWDFLDGSTVGAGGVSGSNTYNIYNPMYNFARIKFVGTSGASTVSATVNKKGF